MCIRDRASKDENTAVRLSIIAGIVCMLVAIPAGMIGVIGLVADWSSMGLAPPPDAASTLPWVVRYLTNPWVATIGLGAIAAAVMSSVDSSILSASSMATWNVYRSLVKPDLSISELKKVLSTCIWIVGLTATLLALNITSVMSFGFCVVILCIVFYFPN